MAGCLRYSRFAPHSVELRNAGSILQTYQKLERPVTENQTSPSSSGGSGTRRKGRELALQALYPVSYTHLTLPTNREV